MKKTCAKCGNSFEGEDRRKYCSRACYLATREVDRSRVCECCGEPFQTKKYPDQRFCSLRCVGMANRRMARIQVCPECGGSFASGTKSRKFCSKRCAGRAREKGAKLIGTVNGMWAFKLLEHAPDAPHLLAAWLAGLTPKQVDAVWPALLTEQFGDGDRASIAQCCQLIRRIYREGALRAVQSDASIPRPQPLASIASTRKLA